MDIKSQNMSDCGSTQKKKNKKKGAKSGVKKNQYDKNIPGYIVSTVVNQMLD